MHAACGTAECAAAPCPVLAFSQQGVSSVTFAALQWPHQGAAQFTPSKSGPGGAGGMRMMSAVGAYRAQGSSGLADVAQHHGNSKRILQHGGVQHSGSRVDRTRAGRCGNVL